MTCSLLGCLACQVHQLLQGSHEPTWLDRPLSSAWRNPSIPVSTTGFGGCRRDRHQTLWPQLRATALTIEGENMVHSDSMSPASNGIWEKLSRRWELKTAQPDVPKIPLEYAWACQVSESLRPIPIPWPVGLNLNHHQIVISWQLSPWVDHRPPSQCILILSGTVDTLVLKHGVRYGQTGTVTVQQQSTTWVQSREAVPPRHTFPGLILKLVDVP